MSRLTAAFAHDRCFENDHPPIYISIALSKAATRLGNVDVHNVARLPGILETCALGKTCARHSAIPIQEIWTAISAVLMRFPGTFHEL